MISSFDYWKNNNHDPLKMMNDFEKRLENIDLIQDEFDNLTFSEQDKHYGVYCFSTVWNNILMWSHYAQSHKGICIGFYEEKLRNLPQLMVRGGLVIYDENYPDIDPTEEDEIKELICTTHYKSNFWSYESEYRISKIFYPNAPTNSDRLFKFPDNCIAEVILGLNISEANRREVITICKSKKIPVYQAFKIPRRFNISCSPI